MDILHYHNHDIGRYCYNMFHWLHDHISYNQNPFGDLTADHNQPAYF